MKAMRSLLRSISVENYKAILETGLVPLEPLTVLIGNNGSGKSSLIEAARTYQRIVLEGVDAAFADALGFEHVRNKWLLTEAKWAVESAGAIRIRLRTSLSGFGECEATLAINTEASGNQVFIQDEIIHSPGSLYFDRNRTEGTLALGRAHPGKSLAREWLGAAPFVEFVERWQFLLLNPDLMGHPRAKRRAGGRMALSLDGDNLAEYLLDLRDQSTAAFDEVVQAMSFVLPYATEIQPQLASDLDRRVYLELVEQSSASRSYRVPGWLFSTGTLRMLAIVALLKHPDPPPVIFIEEIENGLDPRTIGLVVDLLRDATESGRTQVIATSHSPYLLDLLELKDLVLCQRDEYGGPKFIRADSDKALEDWRQDFTPGKLYTMGRLQRMGAIDKAEEAPPRDAEEPEGGWDDAGGASQ